MEFLSIISGLPAILSELYFVLICLNLLFLFFIDLFLDNLLDLFVSLFFLLLFGQTIIIGSDNLLYFSFSICLELFSCHLFHGFLFVLLILLLWFRS